MECKKWSVLICCIYETKNTAYLYVKQRYYRLLLQYCESVWVQMGTTWHTDKRYLGIMTNVTSFAGYRVEEILIFYLHNLDPYWVCIQRVNYLHFPPYVTGGQHDNRTCGTGIPATNKNHKIQWTVSFSRKLQVNARNETARCPERNSMYLEVVTAMDIKLCKNKEKNWRSRYFKTNF